MTQIGKPPMRRSGHRAGASGRGLPAGVKPWVLVAAIIGSSMAFVDGTVVNVALPAIQRELDANAFQAQWVVESYALFLAALLLVGGSMGDRFGRRTLLRAGGGAFRRRLGGAVRSPPLCSQYTARALQGIGGALLVPGILALISANFTEKERGRHRHLVRLQRHHGRRWAGARRLSGRPYSWIWAFLVNVPLALVGSDHLEARAGKSRRRAEAPLDLLGALLATSALGAWSMASSRRLSEGGVHRPCWRHCCSASPAASSFF